MGTFVEISNEFKADFVQAVTEFFDYQAIQCTLNYPPIIETCAACTSNYHEDGTEFNSLADCVVCGGVGNHSTSVTGEIPLVIFWSPSQWKKLSIGSLMDLGVPAGSVLAQGKMADLPKLRQAESILLNSPIRSYQGGVFRIFGEPVDQNQLLHGNFFWVFLTRDEVS